MLVTVTANNCASLIQLCLTQTRNQGLEKVVWVWNPYLERNYASIIFRIKSEQSSGSLNCHLAVTDIKIMPPRKGPLQRTNV